MNRTTLSLIAGTTALVAVTGIAALAAPDGSADDTAAPAARRAVERSSLLCPSPGLSDLAETSYSSFTPVSKGTETGGTAELLPAADTSDSGAKDKKDGKSKDGGKDKTKDKTKDKKDGGGPPAAKPVLSSKEPGKPFSAEASGAGEPALIGTADGRLAPGWTVQQTTAVPVGVARGLLGVTCSAPDTDFWFPGASTADERDDYVHLTNPDDSAAVVDIELYGKEGALKSEVGEGIQVRPHQSVPVLLSTLTDKPQTNLSVHVTVRSGRVAAAVQSSDEKLGADWLPASATASGTLVLPGIPKDATAVRLVLFAPGQNDADLKIQLASPNGPITPAGHETVHVKSGMTAALDLGDVTRGEPGSLLLTPTGKPAPVVAAVRVIRGEHGDQDVAFIAATASVGDRATAAGSRAKGSTLSLVATGSSAKVRVTASAGSGGGSPVSKTFTVKAGATVEAPSLVPSGLKGTYALTVEHLSGGPVYASRMLEDPTGDIPMFTVQSLPDDHGTVEVPRTRQDLSVLQD